MKSDRLQRGRHCLGRVFENRFGFGAGYDTALGAALRYGCDVAGRCVHRSTPRRGYDTRTALEALGQVVRDCLCSLIAIPRIAGPSINVDDHRFTVGLDDGVAAENLEPQRSCSTERSPAQARNLEGITKHPFVAMIEPFEPIGIDLRRAVSDTVEFNEVARHVLLGDNERDAALGKSMQRLVPPGFRRSIYDIRGLRRVEIVALDPNTASRSRLLRVAGDDLTGRRRHMVLREELDHAVAIGVADRIRRIDDDRSRLLRGFETIKNCTTFAHYEYVGATGLEIGVGGDKLDIKASRRQCVTDTFHYCAVVVDTPRRGRHLAVDAQAGLSRVHAPVFPNSRPSPARSAATTSPARSISNTRGRTMPYTGWCSATSHPRSWRSRAKLVVD